MDKIIESISVVKCEVEDMIIDYADPEIEAAVKSVFNTPAKTIFPTTAAKLCVELKTHQHTLHMC